MERTNRQVARWLRAGQPGKFKIAPNLYLFVKSSTNANYQHLYQIGGRSRAHGLGSAKLPLTEIKKRFLSERLLLANGIDPLSAKQAEQTWRRKEAVANKTFRTVARECFDSKSPEWSSPITHRNFRNSLERYAFPALGELPIADIDTPQVCEALRPLWQSKPQLGQRLAGRIAKVIDYAKAQGLRPPGSDNPARWSHHLQHLLPRPDKLVVLEHHPALPYADIPVFMQQLRGVPGIAARALEFTVLTGVRRSEARLAEWQEFDLENGLWVIPARRMKQRKQFRCPLSRQLIQLLRDLPRDGGRYVFLGTRAGAAIGAGAMLGVMRSLRDDGSVHGLRSALRTWSEERTNFRREIWEMALSHSVAGATERAGSAQAGSDWHLAVRDRYLAVRDGQTVRWPMEAELVAAQPSPKLNPSPDQGEGF
jgi:integrase